MTGSASRGQGGRYFYYHCQPGCKERISAHIAHQTFSEWLDSFNFKPEIAELYIAMLEEVFKTEDKSRKKEIARIKNEIEEINSRLLKVERRYLNDAIARDSYIRLKDSFKKEEFNLKERLIDLQTTDSEFIEYMSYGFSVLSHLKQCYESADVDGKQKLLSSIFPEKLIFEKNKYRTTKPSEILNLLCIPDKGLEGIENKKTVQNNGLSHKVARTRIELVFQE